jgi:hypothetical protein
MPIAEVWIADCRLRLTVADGGAIPNLNRYLKSSLENSAVGDR